MHSRELNRQVQRLKALIDQADQASHESLELHGHWARYTCILVAGFLENAIAEVYSEFAKRQCSARVARYVSARVSRIQNPKSYRFIEVADAFDKSWGDTLSEFLDQEGRRDAIDGIMNVRNNVAHGKDTGITVARVKDYLEHSVRVVEFLEVQCGLAETY